MSRAMKPGVAARLIAAQTLEKVDKEGAYANLVLPRALRREQSDNPKFSFRDAALTSELVYGTVRQQALLDFVLGLHSSQPLSEIDAPVLAALRLGAYQILFMRIPEHAAVSETVNVAKITAGERPARFVNAVLRSLLREGKEEALARAENIQDPHARLATLHSHPGWLVTAFEEALAARGIPEEELGEALAANNVAAQVTLVARPGLIEPAELAEEVNDVLGQPTIQGALSPYALTMAGGDPGALPSVRSGVAAVQDEGSQFAAFLLAEAPLEGPDKKWLDLCAGPGGKSALLAAIGAERGVELVANEMNPARAQLVERSTQALSNVKVEVKDGTKFGRPGQFDRVLVDAPCLGMGSLRRRPESRWSHAPSDLDNLVPLQERLLDEGVQSAREGGLIAWVTCSPHPKETISQVDRALRKGNLELVDAVEVASSLTYDDLRLGTGGPIASKTVQLWPHRHGTDAMFIALLEKRTQ